ncbi:hypothetical protein JKP88DRAFT_101142 [Tribonema minus]|uniref:Uncharacterized protein n=1 Tax=Tribonema minus TaxID=303371 RepID=A0A836C6Z0_9STRA|nr:hypothetical protein JKP88DRAFT_101142 [Tribonema minus]
MMSMKLCVVLLALLACVSAFAPVGSGRSLARSAVATRRAVRQLRMSESETEEEQAAAIVEEEEVVEDEAEAPQFGQSGFFQPNANMRYGASRDQDGKSNVWAIEPKMKVEEGENKGASLATGAIILAVAAAAVVATLANLPSPDTY